MKSKLSYDTFLSNYQAAEELASEQPGILLPVIVRLSRRKKSHDAQNRDCVLVGRKQGGKHYQTRRFSTICLQIWIGGRGFV